MVKHNKHIRTKHGASSIFLAIIMSALILVECTFVAFVWNLDYALSVNTALKTQIDTILSDYNRQLFDVYGIYAFTLDSVDDECFRKALEINGLDSQSSLYVSSGYRFTTEDLKKAINTYYWYRGTGVSVKSLVESYSALFLELDSKGIIKKVGQFMQSPAAGYVSDIIKGSDSVEEWIGKAEDVLDVEELIEEIADMDSIKSDYNDAIRDFEFDIDIDIEEWESLLNTMSKLEYAIDTVSDSSDVAMTKMNISHYCAYNFDCLFAPDGDASINGTEFKSIHGKKKVDAEYIITGFDDAPACLSIEFMMVHILIISNMLKDFANEKFRNTMEVLGQIISAIILAVSEGTVDIDYRLIAVGLTYYCAIAQSMKDFHSVTSGKRVVIFEYEEVPCVTFGYREFLFLFALMTPVDDLLERSHEVLIRDFGELYVGLSLEADFRGSTYSVEKCYRLYE